MTVKSKQVVKHSLLTEYDVHLFREGKHYKLYEKLGSHPLELEGEPGTLFAVWAPNAKQVSVIGDFNGWNRQSHILFNREDGSGIWEGFLPGIEEGTTYKYYIESQYNNYKVEKGDPFAFQWECPPQTASVVRDLRYVWNDDRWLAERKEKQETAQPYAIYEVHLGSWKLVPEENNRFLNYREMASELPDYVEKMGYTHVELMPVAEHPFYGSWGYQITGYFAPTSRFGNPQDFMYLVNAFHEKGIGVIIDWVPSHFPSDEHGLVYFDGTHLYEHADPRKGFHPDWQSYIFNYGRNEVKSFLISNACFWLDQYHIDGLRVDAVASMLYLDYSREGEDWVPNEYGSNENLEAIQLLKELNETIYHEFPDVHTIAEESTSWPMVSKPTYVGGLGFGMKWMMGWMHDTLEYFSKDPVHRKYHQDDITFSLYYAFHENFILPLSHDEVVHGKNPLIYKMPGDEWQKFANLRALYAYMYGHPGGNLLFMGQEFGQTSEWSHDRSLDWHLLDYEVHKGSQKLVQRLNQLYKQEKALYEYNFSQEGFEWIDYHDTENSVICFIRKGSNPEDRILVACNFTPTPHEGYRFGVPLKGQWEEILNSDDEQYGGSGVLNGDQLETEDLSNHDYEQSLLLTLPPLGVVYLKKA